MSTLLEDYQAIVGKDYIDQLHQIAKVLKGIKVVHVNSTKQGGGVAEILDQMIPLTNAFGIDCKWEVIHGTPDFFECTKIFHNGLQGKKGSLITSSLLKTFEDVNRENAENLSKILEEADIVIIHDPQPAALISHFPNRKGKWIWRCHIDVSSPNRAIWKYLKQFLVQYDASIFSLADFARPLPHPLYLIPPSIDPLSEKNMELQPEKIDEIYSQFGIDKTRPMALQISRFDRFKDPIGVIASYHLAKKFNSDLQLVLAGGGAPDDPEGEAVLNEVKAATKNNPDIHVLFLPPDSHLTINALQRAADIVIQKSIKEGFGLTVTEALWKSKPVIGGNTGGIRLQIVDDYTGFLVDTPEGCALRIRYLLQYPEIRERLGKIGHEVVKDNFLLTRQLKEYLTLMCTLLLPDGDRIELNKFSKIEK